MITIANKSAPLHFTAADSLNRIATLLKQIAVKIERHNDKTSYWQFIFMQSGANGCSYHGDNLPHMNWQWPTDTWFQEQRRHHIQAVQLPAHHAKNTDGAKFIVAQ
jgi:hypothetical protein